MPFEVWFLRHGDAEPHGSRPDEARELTARGREQSLAAGRALQALDVTFALVLTSPRVRARDTALLASKALGVQPATHLPLSAGFDARQALQLLEGLQDGARILLVGHEPDFSQAVLDLTGARIKMKKGGIAVVRCDRGRGGELLALLAPRELRAMA